MKDGEPLTISTDRGSIYIVISARGEVDLTSAPDLVKAVKDELADDCHNVIIDLSAVTYFDSHGIVALVEARSAISEVDGTLRVVVTSHIRRILTIAGLDRVIWLFDTLDEATDAVDRAIGEVTPPAIG